ncbi:MAG: hypothetical protein IJD09_01745, partial [Clostridia bacterium]|nr:hypothetical protein [Clostridia bacterium]
EPMQTQASAEGAFADLAQCGGKTDFFKAGTVAENFFGQDGKSLGKRDEAIILSMTPAEREDPSLMNASRRRRIAAGSGTTVEMVNRLLKQFEQMQKMVKQLNSKKGKKRRGFGF